MNVFELIERAYECAQADIFYDYEAFGDDGGYRENIDGMLETLEGLKQWAEGNERGPASNAGPGLA